MVEKGELSKCPKFVTFVAVPLIVRVTEEGGDGDNNERITKKAD